MLLHSSQLISGKVNATIAPSFKHSLCFVTLAEDILFALLGLLLPVLLLVSTQRKALPIHWSESMKIRLYYGNGLLLYGMAVATIGVNFFAGRPLSALGLGYGYLPYDLTAVLVLTGFVALYLLDLYHEAGSVEHRDETRRMFKRLGFLPASAKEFLHFLFLAIAAGVGEEVVYRGFMINYLSHYFGTTGWAVLLVLLLPAVAFGLGHLYQGWKAVLKIVVMAVLFGFFFLRTNTLWPLMLVHTAVDVMGGLLSWYLQGQDRR